MAWTESVDELVALLPPLVNCLLRYSHSRVFLRPSKDTLASSMMYPISQELPFVARRNMNRTFLLYKIGIRKRTD